MKFNVGDRVVAVVDDFMKGGVGTVTNAYDGKGSYGVLFDTDKLRGSFGNGAMLMYESEIKKEELR